MRISLHALGTRGDIQPFMALADVLRRRGHGVQLVAPAQFARAAAHLDLPYRELPGGFLELLDSPEGKAAVAGGQGFSAGFKLLKHVGPLMSELMDREWDAVRDFAPDLLITHPKSLAVPHLAQALRRPFVMAAPFPGLTPTRAFASPLLPVRSLGPFNRPSHLLMTHSAGVLFRRPIREWRARALGLATARAQAPAVATLYAYSRHLLPRPADFPPSAHVTGFWFLDSPAYEPPPALARFLSEGAPPVSVGFGSLPGLDPVQLTRTVVDGLALAGKRGVLVGAGGALASADLPSTCIFIAETPYDWLFRQVEVTVHHGGSGTTASSLRAGRPIVACPFMADQPFWARTIEAAGFGPPALDRRKLSAQLLADAIVAAGRPAIRERAAQAARLIGEEGGVEQAADIVEGLRPIGAALT